MNAEHRALRAATARGGHLDLAFDRGDDRDRIGEGGGREDGKGKRQRGEGESGRAKRVQYEHTSQRTSV